MEFRLTPPDPKFTAVTFTTQLLSAIKKQRDESRSGKEALTSQSFRLPVRLRDEFKDACERHNISQSQILRELLEAVVPLLLTDQKPAMEPQQGELQHFMELLRMALPQVVGAPGTPTSGSGTR
jgi:hypothetical protein